MPLQYSVPFFGHVAKNVDEYGNTHFVWEGSETVMAVAYDLPIPGFDTKSTINIRLWSSKPSKVCPTAPLRLFFC